MLYDLIIIGAGPAGITAAVYAARKKINFLVIAQEIGGQTALSGEVENYTGYQFITGQELTQKFIEHMKQFKVEIKEGEAVKEVKKTGQVVKITTDQNSYEAKTTIITSGKTPRSLNIPGEKEFKNKGVSYCATCDAPLFEGMDVAVVGGGNAGLDAVLQLIRIARTIYLIEREPSLKADPIMIEKAQASGKVTIFTKAKALKIQGDNMVRSISIEHEAQVKALAVGGIFIAIGSIPSVSFAPDLNKNEWNEIIVDKHNRTNIEGIFAAGDVTDIPEKQIIIAAGEGSKATLGVFEYLTGQKEASW